MRFLLVVVVLLLPLAAHSQNYSNAPMSCHDVLRDAPPFPHVLAARRMCERSDVQTSQVLAKIFGQPQPSKDVWVLPAYGTPIAKRLGYACIDGLAMRKLPNGWEQVRDETQRYRKCRDS